MFGLFGMVDNALSVATGLVTGELPSRQQIAKLISDGIEVAAVAAAFDVGIDVIEGILED